MHMRVRATRVPWSSILLIGNGGPTVRAPGLKSGVLGKNAGSVHVVDVVNSSLTQDGEQDADQAGILFSRPWADNNDQISSARRNSD
jgi:hypothetical protein